MSDAMIRISIVIGLLFIFIGCGGAGQPDTQSESAETAIHTVIRTNTVISADYFGMHGHDRGQTIHVPNDILAFHTFRTVDSPVTWRLLEPARLQFDWSKADSIISEAYANGDDVVMNLFGTPTWASSNPTQKSAYSGDCTIPTGSACGIAAPPADMRDWDDFIEAFVARYAGRVKYYEIWNEPDGSGYWTGTVEQMVTLASRAYSIIKEIDPEAQVICPSVSNPSHAVSWLSQYFKAGGNRYTDVIGFHGYGFGSNPEEIANAIPSLRSLAATYGLGDAEIWDTEASWGKGEGMTWEQKARWLTSFHLLQAAAGVNRFMWYSYNNGTWGTLTTNPMSAGPYELNTAGAAYNVLAKWLIGTTLHGCELKQENVWSCELTRSGGYSAVVIWSTSDPVTIDLGGNSGFIRQRNVLDDTVKPIIGHYVTADTVPILLENQSGI